MAELNIEDPTRFNKGVFGMYHVYCGEWVRHDDYATLRRAYQAQHYQVEETKRWMDALRKEALDRGHAHYVPHPSGGQPIFEWKKKAPTPKPAKMKPPETPQ